MDVVGGGAVDEALNSYMWTFKVQPSALHVLE